MQFMIQVLLMEKEKNLALKSRTEDIHKFVYGLKVRNNIGSMVKVLILITVPWLYKKVSLFLGKTRYLGIKG